MAIFSLLLLPVGRFNAGTRVASRRAWIGSGDLKSHLNPLKGRAGAGDGIEVLVGIQKTDKEQVNSRELPVSVPGAGLEKAMWLLPSPSTQGLGLQREADLPRTFLQGFPGGQTGVEGDDS